jgi:hypothetical protein
MMAATRKDPQAWRQNGYIAWGGSMRVIRAHTHARIAQMNENEAPCLFFRGRRSVRPLSDGNHKHRHSALSLLC